MTNSFSFSLFFSWDLLVRKNIRTNFLRCHFWFQCATFHRWMAQWFCRSGVEITLRRTSIYFIRKNVQKQEENVFLSFCFFRLTQTEKLLFRYDIQSQSRFCSLRRNFPPFATKYRLIFAPFLVMPHSDKVKHIFFPLIKTKLLQFILEKTSHPTTKCKTDGERAECQQWNAAYLSHGFNGLHFIRWLAFALMHNHISIVLIM